MFERTETQKARCKENFDRRFQTSVKVSQGDEVFIENPHVYKIPSCECTDDEATTKPTQKGGAAHKVFKLNKCLVTVNRYGVEENASKGKVN